MLASSSIKKEIVLSCRATERWEKGSVGKAPGMVPGTVQASADAESPGGERLGGRV